MKRIPPRAAIEAASSLTATKILVLRQASDPIISLTIRISQTRAVKMGLRGDDLLPRFFLKKSLP
jgi:hypothetical protein